MGNLSGIRKGIADNIREICKEKGIKQKDIAEYLGISTGTVANWFSGTNGIDVENLYRLCSYLGVTMNTVFGIDEKGNNLESKFSDPEIHLINIYRALNQIGRDKLTDYAVDLSESDRYRKDTDCGQMG